MQRDEASRFLTTVAESEGDSQARQTIVRSFADKRLCWSIVLVRWLKEARGYPMAFYDDTIVANDAILAVNARTCVMQSNMGVTSFFYFELPGIRIAMLRCDPRDSVTSESSQSSKVN
jgi:hypothetical protein